MERKTGVVKWFDSTKGFGFITGSDGVEVFVHFSGISSEGYKTLNEGDSVSYEVESTDKGEKAVDVLKD